MSKIILKDSEIAQLVTEAIKRIIKESIDTNIYTMDNWHRDGSLKLNPGQLVDDEVVMQLRDNVPPTTYSRGIFQPGEAWTMSVNNRELFMTFVRKNEGWLYVGLCPEGSTTPEKEALYESYFDDEEGDIIDVLDCGTLSDILKKHGWSYSDAQDVRGRDGLDYVKYVVRKDSGKAADLEVVVNALKKASVYPDGIKYSVGQYEFAPEIKIANIYVAQMESDGEQLSLDLQENNDIEMNDESEVQKLVNYIFAHHGDEINDGITISQINDIIQDSYISVFNREMDYSDKYFYRQVRDGLLNRIYGLNK